MAGLSNRLFAFAALGGVGYSVTWEVVNARCLTAQTRKRLYLVGLLQTPSSAEAQEDAKVGGFEFPWIPDLRLQAEDVLQADHEVVASKEGDHFAADAAGRSNAYTITDGQMRQLLDETPGWKPSKLAWQDGVCQTLTSHYAVSIGRGESQVRSEAVFMCI